MKIVYAENMQKQQSWLRALSINMKGSMHKQKNFTDPKIGKRLYF